MSLFKSRPEKLIALLDDAVATLTEVGETYWSASLTDCRNRVAAGEKAAVAHLLTAFSGMGSFNDLWLCQTNGHRVSPADEKRMNTRLDRLRSRMYTVARAIQKSGAHEAI
jgi:uncharacterized protein DUF6966